MKKLLSIILIAALVICAAYAEQYSGIYRIGDRVGDISFTLADGTYVSVQEVLKEKDAVLINFMASWCSYCRDELPHLDAAYRQMSDEIAVYALSGDTNDTPGMLASMWQNLGIETIPYGIDTNGINQLFGCTGYPHNVLIDRNGILCYSVAGYDASWGTEGLTNLMRVYTADDYADPVLLTGIPAPEWFNSDQISTAILHDGLELVLPDDKTIWPFELTEDASAVQPTNSAEAYTKSAFGVMLDADVGEAIAYDIAMNGADGVQLLNVIVDGISAKTHAGDMEMHTEYAAFETAGTHTVIFEFNCFLPSASATAPALQLTNMRKIDAEAAAAMIDTDTEFTSDAFSVEPVSGGMRPANLIIDYFGQVQSLPLAILESDVAQLRIRLGDIGADTAFILTGSSVIPIKALDRDAAGYILPVDRLYHMEDVGYDFNLFADVASLEDQSIGASAELIMPAGEADANAYTAYVQSLYDAQMGDGMVNIRWEYADLDSADAQPADPDAPCIVYAVDANGAPVADVVLQFCDDSTCTMGTTDANGICAQPLSGPCEVHVLKAPDGYIAPADAFEISGNGAEITITLERS